MAWTRTVFKTKKIAKKGKTLMREYQFAITVIAVNVVFMVIYLPWTVTFVLYQTFHFMDFNDPVLMKSLETLDVVIGIANCVAYLNNYSPFFINLMFNSIFRKEFFFVVSENKIRKSLSASIIRTSNS